MGRLRQTKRVNVARVKEGGSTAGRPSRSAETGKERKGARAEGELSWCRCQSNKTVQKSTRQREAATKTKQESLCQPAREASRGEDEEGEVEEREGGEKEREERKRDRGQRC